MRFDHRFYLGLLVRNRLILCMFKVVNKKEGLRSSFCYYNFLLMFFDRPVKLLFVFCLVFWFFFTFVSCPMSYFSPIHLRAMSLNSFPLFLRHTFLCFENQELFRIDNLNRTFRIFNTEGFSHIVDIFKWKILVILASAPL